MDFEDMIMRFLMAVVCFIAPAVLISGEAAFIKVIMYEMFEIDHNLWDTFLPFFFNAQI